jgi:hypothetical protein
LFDPKFQNPDSEASQKDVEWMKKPIDLDRLLAPMAPDQEAQLLNVENPFTARNRGDSPQFQSYSRSKPSEEAEAVEAPQEGAPVAPKHMGVRPSVQSNQPKMPSRIGVRR